MSQHSVLIPAYRPDDKLISVVTKLSSLNVNPIIVVDDGSGPEFSGIFKQISTIPGAVLLGHATNLGKGAALKTGLNYYLLNYPGRAGIVTADADGQHRVEDILTTAAALEESPRDLVLGVRNFSGKVPFRSLLGNTLTDLIFWVLVGQKIGDTQSGLRGIPSSFAPALLKSASNGYEFELDMLIKTKMSGVKIRKNPIETVYLNHNQSSHFNPLIDSMKIYFVFARFISSSLLTAAVDYVIFVTIYKQYENMMMSALGARVVATFVAYSLSKNLVFHSKTARLTSFFKFVALVGVMGLVSYALIEAMVHYMGVNVFIAKIIAESALYLANFAIQRELIFTGEKENES